MQRSLLLTLLLSQPALALAADAASTKIRAALAKAVPNAPIEEITPTPVKNIYAARIGAQTVYVSADGKFLFTGDLIDLETRTNLSERAREKQNSAALARLGADKTVVIGPAKPRHVVTVFTDVDCPYCAKLHLEVPALNKEGVQVRYVFFPRAGLDSESYRRSVAVWCAPDRGKAMGVAKAGGELAMKQCDNPVAEHYRLAQQLQVQGTPAIFLANGSVIPGYVPAEKLTAILDGKDKDGAGR